MCCGSSKMARPASCGNCTRAPGDRAARRRASSRDVSSRPDTRGRSAVRTVLRGGSRGRSGRPPPSVPPGCRESGPRRPSARPRTRRRRARRRAVARAGFGGTRAARPLRAGVNEPARSTASSGAADAKRVELEARLRNEPRFDAIRRPGERHVHAALRQRFRDCDRRQHVSCRPPGCDQAPTLPLCCHDERC